MIATCDFVESIGLQSILNVDPPHDETNRFDIGNDLFDFVSDLSLFERLASARGGEDLAQIVDVLRKEAREVQLRDREKRRGEEEEEEEYQLAMFQFPF
jgi:hypothetical protein